jgi:hypothetical protein
VNPLAQTFGSKLAEQLAPRVLTPALAFWAGGALVLWSAGYGHDWQSRLAALPTVAQVVTLAAALALVAGSAVAAAQLTPAVLRLLEGYWPRHLARAFTRLSARRLTRAEAALPSLSGQAFRGELADLSRLASVERRLHDLPPASSLMPTRFGNILRAAEERPRVRYGLDPVVCWPHLWLVLDTETRQELTQARKDLDQSAQGWLWCLLFVGWTPLAWWAVLVTVLGCALIYYGATLSRGRSYGSLLQAAFDLHRRRLYEALSWPAVDDPAAEPAAGAQLTTYLWRGVAPTDIRFTDQRKPG